ncbi:MAG: hypothetical protein U1F53_05365 [Burkholderiaceae bacterium]
MNDPYAPPTATVADPRADRGATPAQVSWGLRLLWASLLLGVPLVVMSAQRLPDGPAAVFAIVFQLLIFALVAWLNLCIARARNWARIVTLLFTLLGLTMVLLVPTPDDTPVVERLVTGVSSVLDVVAMVLLFSAPASRWFRAAAGG